MIIMAIRWIGIQCFWYSPTLFSKKFVFPSRDTFCEATYVADRTANVSSILSESVVHYTTLWLSSKICIQN